jgi:cysteine desulfuration protein SufE
MKLSEKQQRLADDLAQRRKPAEQLAWLIETARQRPMMDPAQRVEANRVEGCLARLWFVADIRNGKCHFQSESDSLIVKAVAGLLCDFYSDQTPEEILEHSPGFFGQLGLVQHLTPTRRNGLNRVWEKIRAFAASQAHTPASG